MHGIAVRLPRAVPRSPIRDPPESDLYATEIDFDSAALHLDAAGPPSPGATRIEPENSLTSTVPARATSPNGMYSDQESPIQVAARAQPVTPLRSPANQPGPASPKPRAKLLPEPPRELCLKGRGTLRAQHSMARLLHYYWAKAEQPAPLMLRKPNYQLPSDLRSFLSRRPSPPDPNWRRWVPHLQKRAAASERPPRLR